MLIKSLVSLLASLYIPGLTVHDSFVYAIPNQKKFYQNVTTCSDSKTTVLFVLLS